jgi:hypothetical protein
MYRDSAAYLPGKPRRPTSDGFLLASDPVAPAQIIAAASNVFAQRLAAVMGDHTRMM